MIRPKFPIWLIILYALALLALVAWPFVAFMAAFAFDAPGSAQDPAVWRTVGAVLAYPLLPIVGVPGSYFAYRAGRKTLAYVSLGAGLLPVLAFMLGLASIFAVNILFLLGAKF